jgi:hypothetical protein
MRTIFEQLGITCFGIISTMLVVAADVTILWLTGISLVGTTYYYVIPVGALVGGGLSASGYYLGARYTHTRASVSLLILMMIIAGIAYLLIYWIEYRIQYGSNVVIWTIICNSWRNRGLIRALLAVFYVRAKLVYLVIS